MKIRVLEEQVGLDKTALRGMYAEHCMDIANLEKYATTTKNFDRRLSVDRDFFSVHFSGPTVQNIVAMDLVL